MPSSAATLRLVLRVQRVDDLAADVARDPDLVDRDLAGTADRGLHHLGEVAEMAEVIGQPHAGAIRQGLLAPAGFLRHQIDHAAHPAGVEAGPLARAGRIGQQAWRAEDVVGELDRVDARGMRQFVEERLEREAEAVGARRAHRSGGRAQRDHRHAEFEILDHARREFGRPHVGRVGNGAVLRRR